MAVMNFVNSFLDGCRLTVRSIMRQIAVLLARLSGGRLSPNAVTLASLAGHFYIAYLIANRHPIWAAGLLVVFGLLDALDGELARLYGKASSGGMLLDASTDRVKEVLLYTGAAGFYVAIGHPEVAIWAVAASGSSIIVSYVKAKGETAVKDSHLSPSEINRLFQDGLARYEVRMFLFVAGLITSLLPEMLVIITLLSAFTATKRLFSITKKLNDKL